MTAGGEYCDDCGDDPAPGQRLCQRCARTNREEEAAADRGVGSDPEDIIGP